MPLDTGVDIFLLQIHSGWKGGRVKLYDRAVLFTDWEESKISASVLFAKVTCLM